MRWTEERAPSRGNDLDEDAGQERRRGEGRVGEGEQGGGLLENLSIGSRLYSALTVVSGNAGAKS